MQCNTENFVPIVVPIFSTSSSSSSSSSPPMTSSTVSSESVDRQERGDPYGQITIPQCCQAKVSKGKNGETRAIPKHRNGCKNSERILWMTEFLNTETHTPVLLMKYLWSLRLREVRIWVSTMFILISRKTEIARSARGPKSQGLRAEDALAVSYLV